MTTSQYADLIPVDLTADDVFRNLPREQTIGWHAAPHQIIAFGEKILMYRDPANDNKKPEEKEQPDPAETAVSEFEKRLRPSLENLVATHSIKKQQPNRTAQKTFHAPQPQLPKTKSISAKPLKNVMHFYQEQSPEYQELLAADKMLPKKAHAGKKNPGLLKLAHTVIDATIEEMPLPKNSPTLKTAIHIAQLLLSA